jgi:hypothetical protein
MFLGSLLGMWNNFQQMVTSYGHFVTRLDVIPGYELRGQIEIETVADFYHPAVLGDRITFVDSVFHCVPRFIA